MQHAPLIQTITIIIIIFVETREARHKGTECARQNGELLLADGLTGSAPGLIPAPPDDTFQTEKLSLYPTFSSDFLIRNTNAILCER